MGTSRRWAITVPCAARRTCSSTVAS
jgi:hypothetical protein